MNDIQLRKLHISDAPKIALMLNNKKIWDNLRDYIPFPYSEEHAVEFIDMVNYSENQHVFGIEFKSELCGVIGLIHQSGIYRVSAEIGYWLGEEFWGKGIASEAVKLITTYGFDRLNLERIYTGVFSSNIGSVKVLEKNGYIKEAVFKNAIIKNNQMQDEVRYAKLRSF